MGYDEREQNMTSLQINDLTAKVEQSGNLSISTFFQPSILPNPYPTSPAEQILKVVEVEQERGTPQKKEKTQATTNSPKTLDAESKEGAFILEIFLTQARKKYCVAYCVDLERVSRFLVEHAGRKNKTLFTLTEGELDELRRAWFDIELHPSLPVSDAMLEKWSYCLRIFYQWTFEEGYIRQPLLKAWKQSHIKAFIHAERERRALEIQTKARHYNLKEILRAYHRYLKTTYENYEDWNMLIQHLRHFLRFLIG